MSKFRRLLGLFLTILLPAGVAEAAPPVIEWSAAGYTVHENAGTLAVNVVRRGDLSGSSQVQFMTVPASALDGVHFVAASGGLMFAAGESNQTVNLALFDNGLLEPWTVTLSRYFRLVLSNFSNAIPGPSAESRVRLLDDEIARVMDVDFGVGVTGQATGGANNDVFALALLPDQRIVVGGQFTIYNGIPGLAYLTVLRPDGLVDAAFDVGSGVPNASVYAVAAQTNGDFIVAGDFTTVAGVARNRVAGMKSGGGLDTNFIPASVNNSVRALVVQPDGKIIIAGRFTDVGGQPRGRVARLNVDGSLDASFAPVSGANNSIRALALQPDGRVLVAGQFTLFDGVSRNGVARLGTNGLLDLTFDPGTGTDDEVRSVAVQSDGKILIGGEFEIYNGELRSAVARLWPDGTLDAGFNAGPSENDTVRVVRPAAGGKVWIGGGFGTAGGQARRNLALLGTNGLADPFVADADQEVFDIVTQADGRTLVGGDFISLMGIPSLPYPPYLSYLPARLARLNTGSAPPAPPASPRVQFIVSSQTLNERSSPEQKGVERSGDHTVAATVTFSTRDGTAVAGADYLSTSGLLTFLPNETLKYINVPLVNDSVPESTEEFLVALTNALPPAVLGLLTNSAIVLQNDDHGVQFGSDLFATSEPLGLGEFFVVRGGTGDDAVSADFVVESGTALAGADFVATNGTLVFQPGEVTKSVHVRVLTDGLTEGVELISLRLTNVSANATLGARTDASLALHDLDSTFSWNSSFGGAQEAGGFVTLYVVRQGLRQAAASVDYVFSNGTAANGADFLGTNGTLLFLPGEASRSFTIPVLNDGLVEGPEIFNVLLTNPSAEAGLGSESNLLVTLADNDAGFGFVSTNVLASENSAFAILTVRRYDDGAGALHLDYFTSDGTAQDGINYTARSGTLHFPALDTNTMIRTDAISISIPLHDECGPTNERVFTVTLDNASPGGALGSNRIAVVRIQSNDQPGAVDLSFAPGPRADALAVLPDGRILSAAQALVRLWPTGEVDQTFAPYAYGSLANTTWTYDLELLRDGRILASGFSDFGEGFFRWFTRLFPDGTSQTPFEANFPFEPDFGFDFFVNNSAASIVEQPDGRILYARDGSGPGVRRLLANGTNDVTFQPGSGAAGGTGVKTMALQPDGKILLGGDFTSFSGVPRTGLVRLEANGAVDLSFVPPSITPYFPGSSNLLGFTEIELQPDGKILIVGGFTNLTMTSGGSFVRDGLARLLPDGAVDATFDPGMIFGWLPWSAARKILLQPNGRIVIGGNFTTVQGQSYDGLARLNADGTLDTTFFEPNAHSFFNVTALALQADGNILVSAGSGSLGLVRVQGDPVPRVREVTRTNGVAHLRLASRPGKIYVLEASTNLVNWLPLQTNTATDCALEFLDAASPASRRFYRAVQLAP